MVLSLRIALSKAEQHCNYCEDQTTAFQWKDRSTYYEAEPESLLMSAKCVHCSDVKTEEKTANT